MIVNQSNFDWSITIPKLNRCQIHKKEFINWELNPINELFVSYLFFIKKIRME
jgi:hypothetical protein